MFGGAVYAFFYTSSTDHVAFPGCSSIVVSLAIEALWAHPFSLCSKVSFPLQARPADDQGMSTNEQPATVKCTSMVIMREMLAQKT